MKRKLKKFLCSLLITALLLAGLWHFFLAPKVESFLEANSHLLTGFPDFSLSALLDGSFAVDIERWAIERLLTEDGELDLSSLLEILDMEGTGLTGSLDQDALQDAISGFMDSSGDLDLGDIELPDNLEGSDLMDFINGLLNPSGDTTPDNS